MKLYRLKAGPFSSYSTAGGTHVFILDDTDKGGDLPKRGQWLVYADGDDEPIYFGGALKRGFRTLAEAKFALMLRLATEAFDGKDPILGRGKSLSQAFVWRHHKRAKLAHLCIRTYYAADIHFTSLQTLCVEYLDPERIAPEEEPAAEKCVFCTSVKKTIERNRAESERTQ